MCANNEQDQFDDFNEILTKLVANVGEMIYVTELLDIACKQGGSTSLPLSLMATCIENVKVGIEQLLLGTERYATNAEISRNMPKMNTNINIALRCEQHQYVSSGEFEQRNQVETNAKIAESTRQLLEAITPIVIRALSRVQELAPRQGGS